MEVSVNSGSDDLIVEPIEEAVRIYNDLLEELYRFMVRNISSCCSLARSEATTCFVSQTANGNVILLSHHTLLIQILESGIWIFLRSCTDTVLQEAHRSEHEKANALELTMFTVDNGLQVSNTPDQISEEYSCFTNQNILQGPEYRYFASLANRPGPDSLQAFNQITPKITQQSINTINAMLPHVIYKISNSPRAPVTAADKMIDAGPVELFEVIVPRLKLGNDIHMTFKRVGKITLDNLQHLKEQNESWLKIWEQGLTRYEHKTVRLGFDQIKNAMMNLERTMTACLRTIHTHQMRKGW